MLKPSFLNNVQRILFYGDSLTDGSSYPDYVVNTLNALFPYAGFEIINAAVCGNTAADLRKRLAADVLSRKPDLVVMAIGTNDAWRDRPLEQFKDDIGYILAILLKNRTKVLVVLPSPFGDPARDEKFHSYLQVLREEAEKRQCPIADSHSLFHEWQNLGKEVLGQDGVHHGKDGFEAMGRAVLDGLGLREAKLLTLVRPWPGLIAEWETSAPAPRDGSYDPSEAKGWTTFDRDKMMKEQTWWNVPFVQRGGWMPFSGPDEKQVAYGRTKLICLRAGEWEMRIGGSPDPQIVWINGKKVWEGRTAHGYHPDADRVLVSLLEGVNEIVVVSNYMLFIGLYPKEEKK